MKTFDAPLSADEEREYLKMYRDGDQKAGEILILRNLRLVAHMVKHYVPLGKDINELISIGTFGLIKAVRTFDYTKGNRLATYAAKCIDNELLMSFRSERKKYREVSIYDPVGNDKEGNEINIIDVLEAPQGDCLDNFILRSDLSLLKGAIESSLSDRERYIILKRYGLAGFSETTQKDLAAEMGISRSYVSRIEKRAIEKLRDYYIANGN